MPQMKYEPTFASLAQFTCPDWFRDAKFGIWSHWGPQSVPMFGDWYARNMYIEGTPQYLYHLRHYGHPSRFGYKDLCHLWKAERFDPDALMARYVKAGARYFVAQAMHHDHFFNFPSQYNRMNSCRVGPMQDICGRWKAAAERHGLPFGLTEHLSASFSWWRVNKGCDSYGPYAGVPYDGNDPAWRDFYFDNAEHGLEHKDQAQPWYTGNPAFQAYWLKVIKELIDLYTPDLLYTDGSLPFGEHWHDMPSQANLNDPVYRPGLEAVSYLYNASISKHGTNQAVYTQKNRLPEICRVGVVDIEKSQLSGISERPWHSDTCIGNWFYDVRQPFKHSEHIVEILVDIVSKNGTMLLNVLQLPDGSIDDEAKFILDGLTKWFAVCGEGIYGTRPWKVPGEGLSEVLIEGFREERTAWNEIDFRYTSKEGRVYAFMMAPKPGNAAVLRSFGEGERVTRVRLLGGEPLPFVHQFGVLTVQLPERLPAACANCLEITL